MERFKIEEGAKTLVLGWSEEDRMFAGFDVTKHMILMSGRSPSLQIRRETLDAAAASGFSVQTRGNEEIAIAFRPDFLCAYVLELENLHGTARQPEDLAVLRQIAEEPTEQTIPDIPPSPRIVQDYPARPGHAARTARTLPRL